MDSQNDIQKTRGRGIEILNNNLDPQAARKAEYIPTQHLLQGCPDNHRCCSYLDLHRRLLDAGASHDDRPVHPRLSVDGQICQLEAPGSESFYLWEI